MRKSPLPFSILPLALSMCVAAVMFAGGIHPAIAEASSVSKLKRQLRKEVTARDVSAAMNTIDQLAKLDTDDAMDAICDAAFGADLEEVERLSIRRLRDVPRDGDGIKRLAEICTKHKDPRVRMGLIWVMEQRPESEAYTAIVQSLFDRVPGVILTALEVLSKRDSLKAVDYLIQALDLEEKRGRTGALVAYEIRKTLTQLTNEDFEYADDWNNFWKSRRDTFERPEKEKRTKPTTSVKRDPPRFFGMEVNTDRLVFLLDVSGSMKIKDPVPEEEGENGKSKDGSGRTGVGKKKEEEEKKKKPSQDEIPDSRERLSRVQKELIAVIGQLPPTTQFTIITFNHEIQQFESNLVLANERNKRQAIDFVREFKAEGETHTDDALRAAFAYTNIDSIFLLSDGAPRRNDTLMEIEPILEEVRSKNRFRRVRLNAVTFLQAGSNLKKFMKRLSYQNHGQYKELR